LFLYIGSGQIIDTDRIVMILDAQKVSGRQIFGLKQKAKAVILLEDGSFQVSKISARALNKRIERLGGK